LNQICQLFLLIAKSCVPRLAIYLRAHPNPHIIFTSVSMRNLEIYVILVSLVANLIVDAVESTTDADAVQATDNDSIKTAYEATMWVEEKCFSSTEKSLAGTILDQNLILFESIVARGNFRFAG
jgi:hypothetical protein